VGKKRLWGKALFVPEKGERVPSKGQGNDPRDVGRTIRKGVLLVLKEPLVRRGDIIPIDEDSY